MLRLALLGLIISSILGCGEDAYEDTWGNDEISDGKADGLLDSAELLELGDVGTGNVGGQQMDVYAIDLQAGDKITATMTVTSGDLSPHFTLYFLGSYYIGSATFQRQTKSIIKTYDDLADGGRYYVAVKAYQYNGAGNYTFTISCNGGPCAGQSVMPGLSLDEQSECIGKARVCSFAALPAWNGYVGPARARSIFEGCLAGATTVDNGTACDDACVLTADGVELCDDIIDGLPFYADASTACLSQLDVCLDRCHEEIWNETTTAFWETAESMCWRTGFNGNCDSYARGHASCGGTYADGSVEQCLQLCESTTGAWNDDLDSLCTDEC